MAVNCTSTELVTNAACYTQQTLTPAQQKALLVYAKAATLAVASGTDYTAVLSTTLITDATQMVCGITPDGLTAAEISLWMEAGGKTSTTLTAKLDAIKCLVGVDLQTLEKADLLLTCKLLKILTF